MNIQKKQQDDKVILSLSGRLDTITAPKLQETLIPELDAANNVTLDFKELEYVSSAGLRVLLMGEKTAKTKGTVQTLINVSSGIMEILEMTGFTSILHIE